MCKSAHVNLAVVLAAMSTMLWGTRPDGSKVGFNLKVLTYNTHLLPRISEPFASRRGRGDYRARTIGARVAAFDLVGLCEVFDDRRRQALVEAAEATGGRYHVVWTKKPPLKGLTNSGLLLLSRFPVEAHHAITYDHASRFITHGFRADAFAAKGAIHARLRVRDAPPLGIDCFLTHLDSRSAAARAGQLRQLSGFIRTHAGGDRMVLLMGDLNVPADSSPFATDSSYTQLVASLAASGLDWVDAWATAGTGAGGTSDPLADDGGQRIDYIWLACGPSLDPNRVLQHIQVLRYLDGGVPEGSLSDHSGLACKLSDP